MSESGFGALFAYALGRNASADAAFSSAFKRKMSGERTWRDAYHELEIAHNKDVDTARQQFAKYEASIAEKEKKQKYLEEQLSAANVANDELKRQLEAAKAHAVMLDDRLFDITRRHVRLCKQTGTKETPST
ncbi:hypothetical protein AA0313_2857 [Acetobacter indonesiensis NRIC 0313]|uniref:Uncharacterized protein n=2 Tax=Acetobacter TaxID=434 RepID=A0A6N3T3K2_9PROT|nr:MULTISPECIES: hypothetical protein [Acetobacter]KAA8384001.1 hypothetical protein FOH22_15530 [Acetobacter tropicalis]KAA8388469.1 hypothetical protein FOH24_12610 [Acetobacter tropicalis]KGB23844.1 hypothetical protein AtDm6_1560 [Acetobacter tropicalis]MBC9009653.1 hypothetical protein [Acetobacter tropicalis]GAN63320.1 hypothetical protein Abin_024_105 [Acetobacter indonesiensis]